MVKWLPFSEMDTGNLVPIMDEAVFFSFGLIHLGNLYIQLFFIQLRGNSGEDVAPSL